MTDREKVMKGLECCLGSNDCDVEPKEDCPYKGMCLCAMALHLDVFALLKEQDAVEPINSYGTFRCGKCKNIVGYNDGYGHGYQNNYCSKCGKGVKWNDATG